MAARTENTVRIQAPLDLVWDITNDVPAWPGLYSEYAEAEVLEAAPDYVKFRLTMHPDENGVSWSWVSERRLDRANRSVVARRVETGPFEYMNIHWSYEADGDATVMRWAQDFQMKPQAPVDDAGMAERIDANSPIQMELIKNAVERAARLPHLRGRSFNGLDGDVVLANYAGAPLLVVVGNRDTEDQVRHLVEGIADSGLAILHAAHLSSCPKPFRKFAEREVAARWRAQTQRLAGMPHLSPNNAMILDWKGELGREHNFGDKDKTPLVLVADQYLVIRHTIREGGIESIREAVADLAPHPARSHVPA